MRNSESMGIFNKHMLRFIRPATNRNFHCHRRGGLKLITGLRLGLSYLRYNKFKYNSQDTLNPICSCGTVKTNIHCFLHCPTFLNERLTLFSKIESIHESIFSKDNSKSTPLW